MQQIKRSSFHERLEKARGRKPTLYKLLIAVAVIIGRWKQLPEPTLEQGSSL